MISRIIAGDTLTFTASYPTYPASSGWTLTYRLVAPTGTPIAFNASASGPDYSVTVAAATTAGWAAAQYAWTAYVTKAAERYTVGDGVVTVVPDPASGAAVDLRSHARRVLAAIEAILEKRATLDQQRYTIAGRELWRTPIPELLLLRDRYLAEAAREDAAARLAQGLPDRRRLYVRLLRA